MSVSYDEFKQGLKKAKIPISLAQMDALIKYLDKDQDGEIDFSELVIGQNENQKQQQQQQE
jgi:Ca2+-binding EF-hand superfamily protein